MKSRGFIFGSNKDSSRIVTIDEDSGSLDNEDRSSRVQRENMDHLVSVSSHYVNKAKKSFASNEVDGAVAY